MSSSGRPKLGKPSSAFQGVGHPLLAGARVGVATVDEQRAAAPFRRALAGDHHGSGLHLIGGEDRGHMGGGL